MSEHERHYLSAVMRSPRVLDEHPARNAWFSEYRKLHKIILEVNGEGLDLEPGILVDRGASASQVASLDLPGGNIPYHLGKLREGALTAELERISVKLADVSDPNEALSYLEERITDLTVEADHEIVEVQKVVMAGVSDIEARVKAEGALRGLTCGIAGMDARIQGLKPGQLVVIAARTSIGKTALAMTMAMRQALAGITVGFQEMEQSREELGMRWLTMLSRNNLMQVQAGTLTSSDMGGIVDAATKLYNTKMLVDDSPNQDLLDLKASCRLMRRRGAQVIYIDYLGLIGYGSPGMNMYERVGYIVKEIKGLARELAIPIILIAQLNRQAEGERPGLHHIAESGQIEQHADIIVMLHRERDSEEATGIIAKGRNIACQDFFMRFNAESVVYEDIQR